MVKIALLLLVLVFFSGKLFGQSFMEFQNTKDLDEKAIMGYNLGLTFLTKNLDTLKILGDELLEESAHTGNEFCKGHGNFLVGSYHIKTKDIYKGLLYLRDSRNYFADIKDLNMVTEVSNQIGNAYQYMGKFEKATQWYHESLLYGYSSSYEKTRFIAKVNLSMAYAELGDFRTAERHASEYRDWTYEIKSKTAIANAYANIGKICLKQNYNQYAIDNFELSMIYAKKSTSIAQLAHGYTNMGIVKYLQGKKEECIYYFKNALRLHEKVKTLNSILDAYLNLGGAYFEVGDLENANLNYQKGLNLAIKSDKYNSQVEFLTALIELNKLQHLETKALESERDLAEAKHKEFISKVTKIDQLLDEDLKKKRPDNLVMTNRSKEFFDDLVVPLFLFFFVIILGQLFLKRLV